MLSVPKLPTSRTKEESSNRRKSGSERSSRSSRMRNRPSFPRETRKSDRRDCSLMGSSREAKRLEEWDRVLKQQAEDLKLRSESLVVNEKDYELR